MLSWKPKDPDERSDYSVDWTKRLAGDTIASSTFETVTGDVVVEPSTDSFTDTATTVWLTGGTLGETCEVLNRIETAAGRIWDSTQRIKIKAK
jgi:hypothetical protein